MYIVRARDQRPCEEPLTPGDASLLLDRWAADSGELATILSLYESLHGPPLRAGAPPVMIEQTVKPWLRRAFERGELLLIRCPTYTGSGGDQLESRPPAPPPGSSPGSRGHEEPASKLTFIEIQLVDEKGQPVAGEKYRIDLPDGTMRQGTLDANGRARVDEIEPGSCEVSFPGLDASEWRVA